jgi:hypothetical protein
MSSTREVAEQIVNYYAETQGDSAACPHCGEVFANDMLRDDKRVPTHDWPKPCRQVCPGSGQFPVPDATPLINAIDAALRQREEEVRAEERERAAEVVHCAQAVLTALNVGDVQNDSPLHLKLREVMITYRKTIRRAGRGEIADGPM